MDVARVHIWWTQEEEQMIARGEAELTKAGTRFMNIALAQEFSDRTLDSIKSHRKSQAYKALVAEAIAEVQQE